MESEDESPHPERDDLPVLGPTSGERGLDVVAALSSMVPLIGGPLSQVLSGLSADQRMDRIEQVLAYVVDRVDGTSPRANPSLESEEFRDLLEQTLGQAAFESNEEKRQLYGKLLLGLIRDPLESYDPRRRHLRTLEEIQPGQIPLLRELFLMSTTDPTEQGVRGLKDLAKRQATEEEKRAGFITPNLEAIQHLESMGLVYFPRAVSRLPSPTTARRTRETPGFPSLTPYGLSFLEYMISE